MPTFPTNHAGRSTRSGSVFLLCAALFGLPGGLLWLGAPMTEQPAQPRVGTAPSIPAVDGKSVFATRCISCHQANGQGIPGVFPPVDGSEWVTGDKGRLIRIILDGMTGETTVKGVIYSGTMPPWKTFLDDQQIADLTTYLRTSWSNKADPATVKEVALVREATKGRTKPWTEEELMQKEGTGIPGAAAAPGFLGPVKADTTGH